MSKLYWEKSLETGDREIDTHHKAFISQAQRLEAACRTGHGALSVEKMLGFLAQYADHHFRVEETRMREAEYPYITTHLAQHQEYRDHLATLRERLAKSGPSDELADSVCEWLIEWLIRHVKGSDLPMIEFLRTQAS